MATATLPPLSKDSPTAFANKRLTEVNARSSNVRTVPVLTCVDHEHLSAYQCLVRSLIEFFPATDREANDTKGRTRHIMPQQVGVRCRYCAISVQGKIRGSAYFPSKLEGIYQACLNMVVNHFMHVCPHLQPDTRQQLTSLKHNVSVQVGAGKQYSAHSARSLGVYEAFGRLFFEDEALKQPEA